MSFKYLWNSICGRSSICVSIKRIVPVTCATTRHVAHDVSKECSNGWASQKKPGQLAGIVATPSLAEQPHSKTIRQQNVQPKPSTSRPIPAEGHHQVLPKKSRSFKNPSWELPFPSRPGSQHTVLLDWVVCFVTFLFTTLKG